jgi:hypothetical protein
MQDRRASEEMLLSVRAKSYRLLHFGVGRFAIYEVISIQPWK